MDDDAVLAELRQQTMWLRFLAYPSLRESLVVALDTEKRRTVYDLSIGTATSREVGTAAGVSHVTVLRWWDEWARSGLMQATSIPGRARHLVALAEVALSRAVESERKGD
jgi:hypothetical protein